MNPFEDNEENNSTNPFEQSDNFTNDLNDENPFDTNDTKESIANTFSKIDMTIIHNGKKSNTYITNWNINKDELTEHFKIIKKKKGCNGSIKEITEDGSDNIIIKLHLQGNHKIFMIKYFADLGIDESLLCIKG